MDSSRIQLDNEIDALARQVNPRLLQQMVEDFVERVLVLVVFDQFNQAGNGVVPQSGIGIPINRLTLTRSPGTWHTQSAGFIEGNPFDRSACDNIL